MAPSTSAPTTAISLRAVGVYRLENPTVVRGSGVRVTPANIDGAIGADRQRREPVTVARELPPKSAGRAYCIEAPACAGENGAISTNNRRVRPTEQWPFAPPPVTNAHFCLPSELRAYSLPSAEPA